MSFVNGVVVFDYSIWSFRYPELAASVTQPVAQNFFDEAQLYCNNTPCSPIQDLPQRAILLGMMTSHLVALNASLNGEPSSPLVGRISTATQGSVDVEIQNDYPAGSAQWFQQSKYGSAFWQATVQYRSMRYVPGPQPFRNGPGPFRNPWGF